MTLEELKHLAGVGRGVYPKDTVDHSVSGNITHTAAEKVAHMKKHKIQPGTDDWFKLWFARPKLTGENPFGKK
jgi:hypothetical protein